MYVNHEFPIAIAVITVIFALCRDSVIMSYPWYHQNMYNFSFQMVNFEQIL